MLFLKTPLYAPEDALAFLSGSPPEEGDDDKDEAAKKKAAADTAAAAAEEEKKKKPKGKDKDEQVAEIRRRRDELEKENEELKKSKAELDELKGIKPVAEYIKTKFGKVDDESINKFIEKNKERKTKLTDLEKKYLEKEHTVQELEIMHSDLWRDEYAEPLQKADQDLFATIAMVDKEGKIRYPELFTKLKESLLATDKEGKVKNSIQIKQTLKEFATEFKQKTEEDYEVPKLTDVAVAVEGAYNKYTAAVKAKQNWNKTVEEKNKERLFDSTKKEERDKEAIILQRGKALELAKDEFKYDTVDGIFKKEEVKEEFDKVHTYVVDIMKGKEKPTEYHVFAEKMTKASLFDALLEKHKALEVEYEKELGKKHSGLGSGSSSDRRGGDKTIKEKPEHAGIGFLA